MELTIDLKIKKTIWFHILMKFKVWFVKKPLIKLYADDKHVSNIYFKDVINS